MDASRFRSLAIVAATVLFASGGASASVYGPLGNFDVVNDTGGDTCGFEIELEGVHSADVYRTFDAPYIRYATPTMTDTPTGVRIRYQGTWNPATQTFLERTPPAPPGYVPRSDSCWTGGLGSAYDTAGCEHFGVSQTTQPTSTRYRWLSCNPDGTVSPLPDIGLPNPVWTVSPPAVPANPPVVRAEIEIPNPEGAAYGEPYWVKIYKTETDLPVVLDDLLLDDPLIAGGETEIEWELLQAKPGQGLAFNEAPLAAGAQAVVRRYEFYHYQTAWGRAHTFIDPETGLPVPYVDPENGEVVACVVDGCNDPTADELGDYIGRQIAGFNIPPAACSNGVDDDGDGFVDFPADPGCRDANSDLENPQCQDGIDNDGQTGIDYDGGESANGGLALDVPDPHCTQPWRNREAGACGLGAEVPFLFAGLWALSRRRSSRRATDGRAGADAAA